MRISFTYQDRRELFESDAPRIIVGRSQSGAMAPDLDLSPDRTVSRPHARLWREEDGQYWIEDLGSTHGTQINGHEIKGQGRRRIWGEDCLCIGETMLCIEDAAPRPPDIAEDESEDEAADDGAAEAGTAAEDAPAAETSFGPVGAHPAGRIVGVMDASAFAGDAACGLELSAQSAQRIQLLYEFLPQLGAVVQLDTLPQLILDWLVETMPQVTHSSLLLQGTGSGSLLLKAYHSPGGPVASETLARRAMRERIGFIWRHSDETGGGASIARHEIEGGMYAPLIWRGVALGAICVNSSAADSTTGSAADSTTGSAAGSPPAANASAAPDSAAPFSEEDLSLLLAVAHYTAMAMANQMLQDELRRESALKANLLRQVSPRIAEQLLSGSTLQVSGERSEVTILYSDIRGFTNLTRGMEPIEVVGMLNDYFNRLIPIIFAHNGTVDKYIGDAILAVFGSPKPDPNQHENAVRAALDMQAAVAELNAARVQRGKVTCEMGIGVHCGVVLHGFIGILDRMEFTVIGEVVNFAARYCDGARGGQVLISPQVHQWVWKMVEAEATTIETKHEGALSAFRATSIKRYGEVGS